MLTPVLIPSTRFETFLYVTDCMYTQHCRFNQIYLYTIITWFAIKFLQLQIIYLFTSILLLAGGRGALNQLIDSGFLTLI